MNDDVMFGNPVWPDDFYSHSSGHKVRDDFYSHSSDQKVRDDFYSYRSDPEG